MMTIHRPGRSVGQSVGHTGGVITSRSGGRCNGVHLNLAKQFRNLFRGSASALLHASGSPAEEAAVSRCSRKRNPSNGSTAGGQPAGVFLILRPSSTHPVGCLSTGEPISVRIDSIFFKIFWLLKMYRAFAPGTFFFAVFSKILAKIFHFIIFFRRHQLVTPHALRRGDFYYE